MPSPVQLCYSTVTLNFDLLTQIVMRSSLSYNVSLVYKFGENVSRYRVNNVSGRTHGRTDEQDKNSMRPATLRWAEA